MAKAKYNGVYADNKGNLFIETELGTDLIAGKRLRKKSRKDEFG